MVLVAVGVAAGLFGRGPDVHPVHRRAPGVRLPHRLCLRIGRPARSRASPPRVPPGRGRRRRSRLVPGRAATRPGRRPRSTTRSGIGDGARPLFLFSLARHLAAVRARHRHGVLGREGGSETDGRRVARRPGRPGVSRPPASDGCWLRAAAGGLAAVYNIPLAGAPVHRGSDGGQPRPAGRAARPGLLGHRDRRRLDDLPQSATYLDIPASKPRRLPAMPDPIGSSRPIRLSGTPCAIEL